MPHITLNRTEEAGEEHAAVRLLDGAAETAEAVAVPHKVTQSVVRHLTPVSRLGGWGKELRAEVPTILEPKNRSHFGGPDCHQRLHEKRVSMPKRRYLEIVAEVMSVATLR